MYHDTPFSRSLRIQIRVIGALLMREVITRYGRHQGGFLWLMFEPMTFTLGVTTLWTLTGATHGSSLPIVAFAITGYSSVLLWRNTANRCCMAIEPNKLLLFHRNVKVIDLFITRIILEAAGATLSFIVLTTTFVVLGWMKPPDDVGLIILGWAMLALFAAAMGFLIGSLTERSEMAERMWHPISYILFPLSGAVFMVDWLPQKVQPLILLLPMVNGVEMIRGGYFGSEVKVHYNLPYMFLASLVILIIGLSLVREGARHVEF